MIPAAILPKLAKIVRLLASDSEALNCVRALEKLLKSSGVDFNELGDLIEKASSAAPAPTPAPGKRASGRKPWSEMDLDKRLAWLDALQEWGGLKSRERPFIARMFILNASLGQRATATQLATVDRIVTRAWRAGVRP